MPKLVKRRKNKLAGRYRNRWPDKAEISGRMIPKWVADSCRNRWPDHPEIRKAIADIQDETILDNVNYANAQLSSFDDRFEALETIQQSGQTGSSAQMSAITEKLNQIQADIAAIDRGDTGGGTGGGTTDTQWHTDVVDTLSSVDEASWNSLSQLESTNATLAAIQADSAITREYTQFLSSDFNDYWSDTSVQLDGIKTAIENSGGSGGDNTETNALLTSIKGSIDALSDGSNFDANGASAEAQANVSGAVNDLNASLDGHFTSELTEQRYTDIITKSGETIAASQLGDLTTVQGVASQLQSATSVTQIFNIARSSCSPVKYLGHDVDLCPAAAQTSIVLEVLIWALTIIFVFITLTSTVSQIRMT